MAITPNLFSLRFYQDVGAQALNAAGDLLSTKLSDVFDKLRTSFAQSQVVQEALRETPQEFQQINAIIKKAQTNPDDLTVDEIQLTDGILQRLLANDSELLLEFVPHITVDELTLLIEASEWFAQMAEDLSFVDAPEEEFQDAVEFAEESAIVAAPKRPAGHALRLELPSNQRLLEAFDHLTDKLLKRTQGPVARAKGYFAQKQGQANHYLGKGATLVEQVRQINGRAHPLLVTYRRQLLALQSAAVASNPGAIQRIGRELQSTFYLIQSQAPAVFPQQFPTQPELDALTQFNALTLPGLISNATPAPAEMLTAIQPVLDIVQSLYARHEGLLARTIATAEEKVTESVAARADAVVSRVLPKPAADFVLGRTTEATPAPAAPAAPVPAATPPAAGQGTLAQLLSWGGSALAQAASSQAASSVASFLIFGIQQAIGNIGDSPEGKQLKMTLNGILGALRSSKENGSWSEVAQNLFDAAKAPGALTKISGESPEGIFSDNMAALEIAQGKGRTETESKDWMKAAGTEKDLFVSNITHFLTLKHIFEDICHLKPANDKVYQELLKSSKKPMEFDGETIEVIDEEALKESFFDLLAKSNVSLITRLYARLQYFFFGYIVNHYVHKASTVYFNEIFKYIEQQQTDKFDSFRDQYTRNLTRYLTILGGAYENVAKDPRPDGTLSEMLRKELDKKEANLGFETQELYFDFAKIVLEKTVGTGILGWIAKKFITNPEEIVKAVIDKSLGSIKDARGYTHALNTVFREQLEEIWKLLQKELTRKDKDSAEPQTAELSDVKRMELSGLVKSLFEILRKSKCVTKDELKDLIQGTLYTNAQKAVDDTVIEDVIEKVTNILAVCIQTLVQKDQLQKLTYTFTHLVNRTFDPGQEVKLEEMQAEERKIGELSEKILRLTVNGAVEEKLSSFLGTNQQRDTNRFIRELHERSIEYFTSAESKLKELSELDAGFDFSSLDGKNKIKKVVEEAETYEKQCHTSSFQAKSSTLSTGNKDEVEKRYLGIAQLSTPLIQSIAHMQEETTKLENLKQVAPVMREISGILPAMSMSLSRELSADDLSFSQSQSKLLEQKMDALIAMPHLKFSAKTTEFCEKKEKAQQLIEKIAAEKTQALARRGSEVEFKKTLKELKRQIEEINKDVGAKLLTALKGIEDAEQSAQIEDAKREFLKICNRVLVTQHLKEESKKIDATVTDMGKSRKLKEFSDAQSRLNSLLRQIADEKKQLIASRGDRAAFKSKMATLKQQVMEEVINGELKPEFSVSLEKIEKAGIPEIVDTECQKFLDACRKGQEIANSEIAALREQYRRSQQRIEEIIQETQVLDPNMSQSIQRNIREAISQAQKHLRALADWEKANVKEVESGSSYINMKWVQDPVSKRVQDVASSFVFDRVKERLDGFMGLLKREETYRYGILNHLFLIPYVQSQRTITKV